MVCGGCGATIADKAIVCYRCGTPTTAPGAAARQRSAAHPRRLVWSILLAVAAVACLYAAATAPHGSTVHYAWAGAGLLTLVAAVVTFVRSKR